MAQGHHVIELENGIAIWLGTLQFLRKAAIARHLGWDENFFEASPAFHKRILVCGKAGETSHLKPIRHGMIVFRFRLLDAVLAGQHPQLLQSISDSITRFVGDATAQGFMNRVTILTTSEFGRRPADNGSKGSDHGAASSIFLVSHFDNITGGRIGDPPDLSNLDNNGNLGAEFDFRRIYADILRVWFRATAEEVTEVFGEEILPIGVLKPRIINSVFQTTPIKDECLVYPNPNYGSAKFKFKLTENSVIDLKIFRINGTKYCDLYNGYLYSGENSFDINIKESGNFIINIQLANQTINTKFTVY